MALQNIVPAAVSSPIRDRVQPGEKVYCCGNFKIGECIQWRLDLPRQSMGSRAAEEYPAV